MKEHFWFHQNCRYLIEIVSNLDYVYTSFRYTFQYNAQLQAHRRHDKKREKVLCAMARNRFKKSLSDSQPVPSFVGGETAPIGPRRRPLWAVSGPKIAHVLSFPTRIARSRPALERERIPRREKDEARLRPPLCRARVLRHWKLKVSSSIPRGSDRVKWQCARRVVLALYERTISNRDSTEHL